MLVWGALAVVLMSALIIGPFNDSVPGRVRETGHCDDVGTRVNDWSTAVQVGALNTDIFAACHGV